MFFFYRGNWKFLKNNFYIQKLRRYRKIKIKVKIKIKYNFLNYIIIMVENVIFMKKLMTKHY